MKEPGTEFVKVCAFRDLTPEQLLLRTSQRIERTREHNYNLFQRIKEYLCLTLTRPLTQNFRT